MNFGYMHMCRVIQCNLNFIPNQTLKDEYRKGELVSLYCLYWTG